MQGCWHLATRRTAVLAVALGPVVAGAAEPTERTVVFADRTWQVHASDTPCRAGPNRWSDAPQAVQVIDDALVLTVLPDSQGWLSAEISTPLDRRPRSMTVEVEADRLDSNVIAGVFLYLNDTSEIDLEIARWGEPSAQPFQYAVAPANDPSLIHRFDVGPGDSTHHLTWRPHLVRWRSTFDGGQEAWQLRGKSVPRFDDHRLHINLWMLHGGAPAGDGDLRVIIKNIVLAP